MKNNRKKEIVIIVFLLVIAAFPRLFLLDKIPPGIHGDEGWTGIDARVILEKGYISPYVGSALGQPTGPLYLTAILFKLFGESIFILRLSMALFAILTVPLLYVFLKIFLREKIALLTTIAFNFSLYHLSYSRIAFMLISAPFFQLISLIFFFFGRKTKKLSFFILSGIFTGLGVYSYNTFVLFPPVMLLFLISEAIKKRSGYHIKKFLIFTFSFLLVSSPLLKIIITDPQFYFSHHRLYSILNKPEVKQQNSKLNKLKLIFVNGIENTKNFFLGGKIDYVDGFGKYPPFNKFYLLLFLAGLIIGLFKSSHQNNLFLFSLIFFVSGNFLTFEGTYRRQILNLVIFFYFVGIALEFIFKKLKEKRKKKLSFIVFLFLVLFFSFKNLYLYFNHFAKDPETKFVFTHELTKTILTLKNFYQPASPVYFFSSRWSCYYETVRFLLPQLNCADRSKEFGHQQEIPRNCERCFFVLLNNYLDKIKEIKEVYPKGKEIKIFDEDTKMLIGIIYFL